MAFEIILDKEEVGTSIFLKDLVTGCQVSVLTFGALLNGFAIPIQGEYWNVIDSYSDNQDASENIETLFKSARLSPFPGRIRKGHFTFNTKDHKIEKFYLGANAIHGLMYDHNYEIAETKKTAQKAEVHLKGFYAGSDNGYPYKYLSDIIYRLEDGNKLTVESYIQHFNEHAIPYGEGWHPYFQLSRPVDECALRINSNIRFKHDKNVLSTGEKLNDERFIAAHSLQGITLDDCFELIADKGTAAVLSDDVFQLTIKVNQGYKYLQAYTPDDRNSIALECLSMLPDAFNHGIGLMMLEPGKKYVFSCSYILQEATV